MANAINLGGPPRLTGDANADMAGLIEWVWAFYNATITTGGVLQPGQLASELESQFPTVYSLGILIGTDADKIGYFSAPETFALTDYTAFARQWDALPDDVAARALLGITAYTDEQVRDVVGALVQNGTGITWVYDDGADTLIATVTITQYTDELAQDAVGGILTNTTTISLTYNDAANQITADVRANSVAVGKLTFTATDFLAGRSTAGAGAGEEIACTAAGRALLDDANAAAQATTLGLGTGDTPTFTGAILTDNLTLPKTSGKGIKVDTAAPTFPWADIIGNVEPKASGAGSPARAIYSGGSVGQYAFVANDVCDFTFHIPHDYAPGTDIYFHVHWSHTGTTTTGNAVFDIYHQYAKGHNQANFGTEKNITITYDTVDVATTPQYRHRIDEVIISGASATATLMDRDDIEVDGLLNITLKLTALPTLGGGGKLFVHTCDIHYQSTNVGTKQRAPDFYT